MQVFLSWSGKESKQLAAIFKEWLPNVLQFVEPYMSAKDISFGERWNNNITGNLQESSYGLIFVTPSNINAPWINFEAGALSKTLDSKVVPILYNANVMMLNEGPLKQFQSATNLDRENVFGLLKSINNANEQGSLDESRLVKAFDMWWGDLEKSINEIVEETISEDTSNAEEPSEKEILSVIYSKLTEQEKLLKMNRNLTSHDFSQEMDINVLLDLENGLVALEMCVNEINEGAYDDGVKLFVKNGSKNLSKAISYLKRRFRFNELKDIPKPNR
ncbi:hypothetical protein B1B04_18840 [Lysinibacillus sp. KCTC 33748]|uniref:toll/interleukin-1 receptor domain-containing protein n=1 Tax=unclassified Lysinibacillus TaxID=2636778 RepID=UPI0009A5B205|nr:MULTISPECIES: toll/interleukin-1 receptor domain-containing protein [unclassified Lysinibacillus]OXS70221.1 hypothetical protein B1B04_18840 [Lysinibacillus sp. KCTC 33748]SKC04857.1 TIR domain-containing protein [Lysinibacillus sp. AC-3]